MTALIAVQPVLPAMPLRSTMPPTLTAVSYTHLDVYKRQTLRNIIGEMELDHTLTSRDVINGKITAILDEATDKWGIKVNRVEDVYKRQKQGSPPAYSTDGEPEF